MNHDDAILRISCGNTFRKSATLFSKAYASQSIYAFPELKVANF